MYVVNDERLVGVISFRGPSLLTLCLDDLQILTESSRIPYEVLALIKVKIHFRFSYMTSQENFCLVHSSSCTIGKLVSSSARPSKITTYQMPVTGLRETRRSRHCSRSPALCTENPPNRLLAQDLLNRRSLPIAEGDLMMHWNVSIVSERRSKEGRCSITLASTLMSLNRGRIVILNRAMARAVSSEFTDWCCASLSPHTRDCTPNRKRRSNSFAGR
jgi:hypothetical protein